MQQQPIGPDEVREPVPPRTPAPSRPVTQGVSRASRGTPPQRSSGGQGAPLQMWTSNFAGKVNRDKAGGRGGAGPDVKPGGRSDMPRQSPHLSTRTGTVITDEEEKLSQLAVFSPAIAVRELSESPAAPDAAFSPSAWEFEAIVLFVDISGFTNLATRLDVDALQRHINRYFTLLLNIINTHGGDVLRFMGDAVLVTWAISPAWSEERLRLLLREAAHAACKCALELDARCGDYAVSEPGCDATLSIHSGLGVGKLVAFRVGSAERAEFLVAGDPIRQIGVAEGNAARRQCVFSPEAWEIVDDGSGSVFGRPILTGDDESDGCVLLVSVDAAAAERSTALAAKELSAELGQQETPRLKDGLLTQTYLELQRTMRMHELPDALDIERRLRAYVHPVAADAIRNGKGMRQVAEQRSVIVVFAKVDGLEERLMDGNGETPETALATQLKTVQDCLAAASRCITLTGGVLRQFVLDDKGAVLIWTFGLPKSTYEDNARRGLESAFDVCDALLSIGLSPRAGVTSGVTFCGVVGSPHRCEYAVMGPCVNLAARLMCQAENKNARVLCNAELRDRIVERNIEDFSFSSFPPVKVKVDSCVLRSLCGYDGIEMIAHYSSSCVSALKKVGACCFVRHGCDDIDDIYIALTMSCVAFWRHAVACTAGLYGVGHILFAEPSAACWRRGRWLGS